MNPREFLETADDLISGLREADWRSAVSRAYYAAFHTARRLLLTCGFSVPPTDQAHAYLWLRLENSGHLDAQSAGRNLTTLRKTRNSADYDLGRPFAHPTAFRQVQIAEDIIQLLETIEADAVIRSRVTDAMKIYERDVLGEVTWHA